MARGGSIINMDGILLIGIIAGAVIYKDEISAFFRDFGKDFGIGKCPVGQHRNDENICVEDGPGDMNATHIYPTTGKKCNCGAQKQSISCSGGSATSMRVNCNGCKLVNYEATAILQFGGGCTSSCGDEATIKHYGPTHQDGNCCWALSNVQQNGQCFFGGEGPHPQTNKSAVKLGSVGDLQGKKIGVKSIIWKTSSGAHQELYVDITGAGNRWREMGKRDIIKWGDQKTSNKVASDQQVEFRVDCSKAKWLSFEVAEIKPRG